jgi:SH3 domain protein
MRLIFGVLALLPLAVVAETAYVTDVLRLGLYAAEDTSGKSFRALESGQEMEILSRNRNYANVRLPDNTEGWVKAAYLVSEKPARLIVAEVNAARDALASELEETRQAFAAPAATITALQSQQAELQSQIDAADAKFAALQEENASFQGLEDRYRGSLPLTWVMTALGVTAVAGFLLALWWVDFRSRRRHGGIRIY